MFCLYIHTCFYVEFYYSATTLTSLFIAIFTQLSNILNIHKTKRKQTYYTFYCKYNTQKSLN